MQKLKKSKYKLLKNKGARGFYMCGISGQKVEEKRRNNNINNVKKESWLSFCFYMCEGLAGSSWLSFCFFYKFRFYKFCFFFLFALPNSSFYHFSLCLIKKESNGQILQCYCFSHASSCLHCHSYISSSLCSCSLFSSRGIWYFNFLIYFYIHIYYKIY